MNRYLAAAALLGMALCGTAQGQECTQVIEGNDLIQWNLTEIRVSAECEEVTIDLIHTGQLAANVMGHNWVLTTTADYMPLATVAAMAGPPEYLPEGDPRVLATTRMIGGGEETSVTFSLAGLEAGGDYTYFCSFPGHYVLMNGKFIIE
jgi:azurin